MDDDALEAILGYNITSDGLSDWGYHSPRYDDNWSNTVRTNNLPSYNDSRMNLRIENISETLTQNGFKNHIEANFVGVRSVSFQNSSQGTFTAVVTVESPEKLNCIFDALKGNQFDGLPIRINKF